jgi:hypothetical protein
MEAHMMAYGRMESLMDKVIISALPCNIMEAGKRTNFMVMGLQYGKMEGNMKEIIKMERNRERVPINIRMDENM